MLLFVLLSVLLKIPLSKTEIEDIQEVCAGQDFRLPVYSASRVVTFTPNNPPGPRRVLLNKNDVQDPRFKWTRDRTLLLKDVAHSDQGLYSIKLHSGFTYETVRLTVSECIKNYRREYGETFQYNIPKDGSLLEFFPRGSPPESQPVVLWNQSDPESGRRGRGRVQQDGRVWVAEKVTQADQGNYTFRNEHGKVLSRSSLTVQGHIFNVTRFPKDYVNIPLVLPVAHAHLIFIPAPHRDDPHVSTFELYPRRGPVQLIRDGQIVEQDSRYWNAISLNRDGAVNEVVISRLSARHDGLYEIRDREGNLVSSTYLHVIDESQENSARWRGVLKSFAVPSGMFVTIAGFFLFLKHYPNCSVTQIVNGLRANPTPRANPPRITVEENSLPRPQPGRNNQPLLPGTPGKWSPSQTQLKYTPSVESGPLLSPGPSTTGGQVAGRQRDDTATNSGLRTADSESRKPETSVSVPGDSNCLHSSDDCVQFQIKPEGDHKLRSKAKDFVPILPLDTDTSAHCSVYTSDKLNFSSKHA